MKYGIVAGFGLAIAMCFASQVKAVPLAYIVTNSGNQLRSFDLATPGVVNSIGNFSGAVTSIDGIDFRPANGLLYGYSSFTNQLVTINPSTAFTTLASMPTTASVTDNLGVDFNPVPDRMRLVNVSDQNLRINVDTGATTVDGSLAYAAADPNFGVNPNVNEVAYTNSDINPATGTTLYYLDYALDILATTTNPNGGVLNTVGPLGVNTSLFTGFDILSNGIGGNTAYATLNVGGIGSLYQINLATGAATNLGALGVAESYGLAIVQPVPEPGSVMIALGLTGVGFVSFSRRRSKHD